MVEELSKDEGIDEKDIHLSVHENLLDVKDQNEDGDSKTETVVEVSKMQRNMSIGVILLAAFAMTANYSVFSIALPLLATYFHTDENTVAWVTIGPMLVSSCLVPIAGKVADDFGRRKIWLMGFTLNLISLVICGFAPNLPILIAGRILSGIGGAMDGPSSFGLIAGYFPPEKRATPIGLMTGVLSVSPSLGILLGGVAIEYVSWRWLFWGPLPFVALGLGLAFFLLKENYQPKQRKEFDWKGSVTITVAIATILFAVNQIERFGITSWIILSSFAIGVTSLILFVWNEKIISNPVMPMQIFKDKIIVASLSSRFILLFCYMGYFIMLPFFMSKIQGFSSSSLSFALFVRPLSVSIASTISGKLASFLKSRIENNYGTVALLGSIVFVISGIMFLFLNEKSPLIYIMGAIVLQGAGWGLLSPVNVIVMTNRVPNSMISTINGLSALLMNVSSTAGVTVILSSVTVFGGTGSFIAYHTTFWLLAIGLIIGELITIWEFIMLRNDLPPLWAELEPQEIELNDKPIK